MWLVTLTKSSFYLKIFLNEITLYFEPGVTAFILTGLLAVSSLVNFHCRKKTEKHKQLMSHILLFAFQKKANKKQSKTDSSCALWHREQNLVSAYIRNEFLTKILSETTNIQNNCIESFFLRMASVIKS